jgi:hypothetical protein
LLITDQWPDRGKEARREMSRRLSFGLGTTRTLLALPLALALFLPAFFRDASAQQQLAPGAQSPASQAPAPLTKAPPLVPAATPTTPTAAPAPSAIPPAAAPPMAPVPIDWGLCQCIGDKQGLDFTCPGSADACQASCGKQFSFKPDARCRQAAASH